MFKKNFWLFVLKTVAFLIASIGSLLYIVQAFAANATGIGGLTTSITSSFEGVGKLMIATAYVAGIGFTIAAIFKFKQHRDNPTQIPIGTPIALLAVGIVLIFLPGIIKPAGETIFGANAQNAAGGFTGGGVNALPKS
jgi:intracellular multiplication protein IcmD